MTPQVVIEVRFDGDRILRVDEYAGSDGLVASLNRARDQMVVLLSQDEKEGRPHSPQERADGPNHEGA